MGVSSLSHNDLMNFRSRFIKNNGKIDSEGGSSGFNNYVKNNCAVSGISGHASQKSGGAFSSGPQMHH